MKFQPIPSIFYPNDELADFLLVNGFTEITHQSEAALAMNHRDFRHEATHLFVSIDKATPQIVLENTSGWLWRYYSYLSAAALVYLVTASPKKAADQALFDVLADLKP